jgi:hypothetical protein
MDNTDSMEEEISEIRQRIVAKILAKQDEHFRWAFDEEMARQRPELAHYWPKYRSTVWTLLFLADLEAPTDLPQIGRAFDIITEQLYDPEHGIFGLGFGHFPIPCLNGNMVFLHYYLQRPPNSQMDGIVDFFDRYQRFDDGDFKTPKTFPYFSNKSCYGRHTCYWGIVKLLKGCSFIPASARTPAARRLIENSLDFILQHEVCFRSHSKGEFIHPKMDALTFPNLWWVNFLEVLWLLKREGVKDRRMRRALELLRSRQQQDGYWHLDHPVPDLIIPMGRKDGADVFITARAKEVLEYYGY